MVISVGDYVQIKNSRTDDAADVIFKGRVIQLRHSQSGQIALIRNFNNILAYENIEDLTKLRLKDVLRFFV